MVLEEFTQSFEFQFNQSLISKGTFKAFTRVVRKSNQDVVDSISTLFKIPDNAWEGDVNHSQLEDWDWGTMYDQVKRFHLSYFAIRANIEDFFPLNPDVDISNLI